MGIDAGVVSEQRLSAQTHRESFAAVRQTHPCRWDRSLWCVLRRSNVAFNFVSSFVNRKDCVGLRRASRAFATCMAEVSPALVRPRVLVCGGGEGSYPDAVENFDPVSNTWDSFPAAQAFQFYSRDASAVINGRLYVCGGYSDDLLSHSTSLDCFDPMQGIWQPLPPMSEGRCCHAAAVVGARLYVFGGRCTHRRLGSAESFDTVSNLLPAMGEPRCVAEAAVIKNHVYVIGGDEFGASAELLLPTENWQELPHMNVARACLATAVIADRLYVCGGVSMTLERFDPEVGAWELLQPRFENHNFSSAAVLDGHLYVCGGVDVNLVPTSSVERFDPTRDRWERLASMAHARLFAGVVEMDGRLFVCGGAEANGDDLNSAELFDPVTGRWELMPGMGQRRGRPHLAVIPC